MRGEERGGNDSTYTMTIRDNKEERRGTHIRPGQYVCKVLGVQQ